MNGTIKLRSGDGRIQASNSSGNVSASTGDGRIEFDGVDGAVEATTADGRVRVSGKLTAVRARSGDGSITIEARPGSATEADWDITSGDGAVTLQVPDDFNADPRRTRGTAASMNGVSVTSNHHAEHRPRPAGFGRLFARADRDRPSRCGARSSAGLPPACS